MAEDENSSPDGGRPGRNISWGLIVLPLMLFGFTAAMIHTPTPAAAPPSAKERLAKRGISPTLQTALEAAANDDVLVLRLLREAGVSLDKVSPGGSTPLIEATLAGSNIAMGWLIESAGVELDTAGADGRTPLWRAIAAGLPEQAERLLDAGAAPPATDPGEQTLLGLAASGGDLESLALLIRRGLRAGASEALADAVRDQKLPVAKRLLEDIDGLRPPPLHPAIEHGDAPMAELLIAHGADFTTRDASGATPLGLALRRGDWPMVELLAAAGADLDSPALADTTPLEHAFDSGERELAARLLETGAAPHPVLFRRAAEKGDSRWMRLLADHGAPLDPPLADGDTLLSRALRIGDGERVRGLLYLGADPSRPGELGQAPLVIAIAKRSPAFTQTLLDAGADPNAHLAHPVRDAFHELAASKTLSYYMKRDSRFTPLMVAAAIGEPDTIRALLACGASRANYTRSWKRYPISFAAEAKHIEAQQLLVGYDPDKAADSYKIVISLSKQRATLYKNGEVIDSSKVSTGKKGYRTPTGEYIVSHKHRHHKSSLYDSAPMPYFMRFSCGAFGTHTGYCPGYPASHGCIRMPDSKAKAFFYTAPTGTPVSIVD